MKVGIINVTGYAGMELARILHRHPEVEITAATGRGLAGKRLGEVFPHLSECDIEITPDITDSVDFVFSALPHAASAERLEPFVADGIKVYNLDGHRHHPKITQELGELNGGADLRLTFLTHFVPMTRGILANCYAPLKREACSKRRGWQSSSPGHL